MDAAGGILPPMADSPISKFYDQTAQQQWDRLSVFRTEFEITLRALRKHLPPPNARIADIGGGVGRYAIELSKWGYDVHLSDISVNAIAFAVQKANEAGVSFADARVCDARDLSDLESECFDGAMYLGPFYHLLTEQDRELALAEASRILKPGGVIFAAFIPLFTLPRFLAKFNPQGILTEQARLNELFDSGVMRMPSKGAMLPDAWCIRPEDIEPFVSRGGFQRLDLIACEGLIGMIGEHVNQLSGSAWEKWLDLNEQFSREPSLYGSVQHLLYVGKKV